MSYDVIGVSGELVNHKDLKFILTVSMELYGGVGIENLYYHKDHDAYYTTNWEGDGPDRPAASVLKLDTKDAARSWVEAAYKPAIRECA